MKEEIKKYWNFYEIYYTITMETYILRCKRNTANENSSVRKTKQNILILLSNCAVCGNKKSTYFY